MPPPTPYSKLLVSVNGGAATSGGIDVPSAATLQFSGESTVGWRQQRYELYDYPEGFATPAGWTLAADGTIFYAASAIPPLVTLPANTVLWGPWSGRLKINEAIDDNATTVPNLVDETTICNMLSPRGQRMVAALEGVQFCSPTTLHKRWVRTLQRNQQIIEPLLGGTGDITDEVVTWSPTASPNGEAQSIHKTFDTANATQATAMTIALPDEAFADLTATVLGRSADDRHFAIDLRASWSRTDAAAPAVQRAPATSNALAGNPVGWAAVLDVNGNNARVRVTGEAALAIRWSVLAQAQIAMLNATPAAGNPLAIFGANLKGWLNETYAAGVWTDESTAAPANTSQTNVAKRPAASTINGHVAVLFDGTDDALNWGGDRELLTGDYTVFAVIQSPTGAAPSQILSKLYGAIAWYLGTTFWGTAGKWATGANDDVATAFAESNASLADSTPHTIVGVRSGTTVTLYVDGVLQADTGTNASAAITNGAEFICVGAAMNTSDGTTTAHYTGKMGQVGMVNRAPTGPELASLNAFLMGWAGI